MSINSDLKLCIGNFTPGPNKPKGFRIVTGSVYD